MLKMLPIKLTAIKLTELLIIARKWGLKKKRKNLASAFLIAPIENEL
jgi:hypothetical protein